MEPKQKRVYEVRATWDAEAGCWWAESDDIPGLVSEAATLEELLERVTEVAPELLAANDALGDMQEVPIHLTAERFERVRLAT